jgi:hypothetical protein
MMKYFLILFMFLSPIYSTEYAILISKKTQNKAEWGKVTEALKDKYPGAVESTFESSPAECLAFLKKHLPRFTCIVAESDEVTREFVAAIHETSRQMDDDPYADTFWGILTGFNAENALKIAKTKKPLEIKRVASGTELAMDMIHEGKWYCELVKSKMVEKKAGNQVTTQTVPADTTKALVDSLNVYKPDMFVTSGHATERNWMIGFSYKNGFFICKDGQLIGLDTKRQGFKINSPNPKVYMPIGNCLMGHIKGKNSMALAWMNSAGVHQMLGYTVPTWYGYAGWGCLDYFVEQPGRYTYTEAFYANQHALIHRIQECFPKPSSPLTETAKKLKLTAHDRKGMHFDKNVVVFYGDPGWQARMKDRPKFYTQKLEEKDGIYTFTITGANGAKSFSPVNTNGAQRGWRPIIQHFNKRLKNIELIDDSELEAVIVDDFILVPNPRKYDPEKKYVVKFKADKLTLSDK